MLGDVEDEHKLIVQTC